LSWVGSIQQCGESYPFGRPELAAWSRKGKGYGYLLCDGSNPPLGKVIGR